MRKAFLLSVAAMVMVGAAGVRALEPQQLLEKCDAAEYAAKDTTAWVKMLLIESDGKTSERKLKMLQKGNSKRLIAFESPADVKGVAFLDVDGKMHVYLPAFHKVRLVAGSAKNENFAGTDFAHDDLSSERFSDRLQAQSVAEEGDFYILQAKEKDADSRYSKLVIRIRKQDLLFDQVKYYDTSGQQVKEFSREDFRPIGPYTQSYLAQMTDMRKNHTTKMIVEKLEVDKNLADSLFSQRQLKRQ